MNSVELGVKTSCFIHFQESTEGYALPERFTFPFYYEPHPLCLLAAKELQTYINQQSEIEHDFGLDNARLGLGKMFGVLVVQNKVGEIGYLAAFSGKLAGKNYPSQFVPPVFDIFKKNSFFRIGEIEVSKINNRIEKLETDIHFIDLKSQLQTSTQLLNEQLTELKNEQRAAKTARDIRRKEATETLSKAEFEILQAELGKESVNWAYHVKDSSRKFTENLNLIQEKLNVYSDEINALKEERKNKSNRLQIQIFKHFSFLNQRGEKKNLCDIFPISDNDLPPSGAGECAAPKLLQYAFLHELKPISMAEFWWGQSPNSEIRKHGLFYPACKSKCEPILAHMLDGILMDENPMLLNPAEGKELEIIYEDDYLLVLNKPAEFLSVPGKKIDDCVFSRMKEKYPDATGPLVVHRLDMSTSGLMLIAKTKDVHQNLQNQFIKRKIKKRYTALLDGIVEKDEGFIDLPLRVDLEDRPRQLVCYEYGKPAQTAWKVIERRDFTTKIHFFPITGRTHQLRVHASHPLGLNLSIVGDDLYGKIADRLYLHAEALEFTHPISHEMMKIEVAATF